MTNKAHTARQLVQALQDFIAANPEEADQPVGFTTDSLAALESGQGGVWFVQALIADPDSGAALLTRGR